MMEGCDDLYNDGNIREMNSIQLTDGPSSGISFLCDEGGEHRPYLPLASNSLHGLGMVSGHAKFHIQIDSEEEIHGKIIRNLQKIMLPADDIIVSKDVIAEENLHIFSDHVPIMPEMKALPEDKVHIEQVAIGTKEIVKIEPNDVEFRFSFNWSHHGSVSSASDVPLSQQVSNREKGDEMIPCSNVIIIDFEEPENMDHSEDSHSSQSNAIKNLWGDTVPRPDKTLLYRCSICEMTFKTQGGLGQHIKIHSSSGKFQCLHCEMSFKRRAYLTNHMRTHTGDKPYVCKHCDVTFASSSSLRTHVRTHTGERPFMCPHCGATFPRKDGLKSHIRTNHTREKPYKCSQCPATFGRTWHLRLHMSRHTGYKPFQCDRCDKSFNQDCNLRTHMRVHTGEKPFKCTECSRAFAQFTNLKSHIQTHLAPHERSFSCSICHTVFSSSMKIKEHILKEHNQDEKNFSCAICGMTFRFLGALQSHFNTSHIVI